MVTKNLRTVIPPWFMIRTS